MNTVKIIPQIVDTADGPRMSYVVAAQIDGHEVVTRHKFHTEANARAYHLRRDYGCKEIDNH